MFTQRLTEKLLTIDSLLATAVATTTSNQDQRYAIARQINALRTIENRHLVPQLAANVNTASMVAAIATRYETIRTALATFYDSGLAADATALRTAVTAHRTAMTGTVYPAYVTNVGSEANYHYDMIANLQP